VGLTLQTFNNTHRERTMLRIIETHGFHFPFTRYSDRANRAVIMVPDEFGNLVAVPAGATLHSLCS
jgi:hypothetical protein